MALKDPLHEGQLEVLRWVRAGCPDGKWEGHRHKATASALASRRLITVSRKTGTWNAAILPAGAYYLECGGYPPNHWQTRKPRTEPEKQSERQRPAGIARSTQTPAATPRPTPRAASPNVPKPTQKLLHDLLAAGGRLVYDASTDTAHYSQLVGIINGRSLAPDGDRVILTKRANGQIEVRLASVSDWTTQQPSDIADSAKARKSHAAVSELRTSRACSSISPAAVRARAFRLLNAIAHEATSRGIEVSAVKFDRDGFRQNASGLNGDLILKQDRVQCSVSVVQLTDKVPHEPTDAELRRKQRQKYAYIPDYDYVPSEQLKIVVRTDARYAASRKAWSDTKALALEYRLPDVLETILGWERSDKAHAERERLAQIEQQARRERENELATEAYYEQRRVEHFLGAFDAWEKHGRMVVFLGVMTEHVRQIEHEGDRAAALDWLEWCRAYVDKSDPLSGSIQLVDTPPPSYAELSEFRRRSGFTPY